ncbi:MAG: hypothetical protein QNJ46_12430 [Leptolyngbyaceae cyanobacterium MO_188.B28]|nr:hypothetical protein [Leptolyngbyaceae cyanobacterium MO_188.B28]
MLESLSIKRCGGLQASISLDESLNDVISSPQLDSTYWGDEAETQAYQIETCKAFEWKEDYRRRTEILDDNILTANGVWRVSDVANAYSA